MSFSGRKFSINRHTGAPKTLARRFSMGEPSTNGTLALSLACCRCGFSPPFSPARELPLSRKALMLPLQAHLADLTGCAP